MKQIERITKNLQELIEHGAKISLSKTKKYWLLIYKDNEKSNAKYILGLSDIEKFVMDRCCELDNKTGIKF